MTPRLRPVLVLALAASSTAWAVQPHERLRQGADPVVTRTFHADAQAAWRGSEAWRAFAEGEGQGWDVRFDEHTGTPHRMWGRGLPVGPIRGAADAEKAAIAFAERHATLLGVDGLTLVPRGAGEIADGKWSVFVDALVDGLPVYRSGLTFRFQDDRLVMVGAETWPSASRASAHTLTADDATRAFLAAGPQQGAQHEVLGAEAMWLPEIRAGRPALRPVWVVSTRVDGVPPAQWKGFVDAATGELVTFFNEVRFVDGTLTIEHDDRLGQGGLTTSPLRYARVQGDGASTTTDDAGAFSVAGATASVELTGPYVRTIDRQGDNEPTVGAGATTLTGSDFANRYAAQTTYVSVMKVQDTARHFAPEVGWVDDDVRATVNIDDVCNAWFDGSINFLQAGSGCRNTGRLADVVYHEWGHGFHAYSLVPGAPYDGSVGEGAADVMATLVTGESDVAPGFFSNDNGPLRDTDNRAKFPDDFRSGEQFIHYNGLIFGGSMWDTRMALEADLGAEPGREVFGNLFADMIKSGPDVTTAYDETVFADDDDADLSNGTPHQCAIVEGFGAHGLGPIGGYGVRPANEQPWQVTETVAPELVFTVGNPAPECISVEPTGGTLHYRVNGAEWMASTLDADGADVKAALPLSDLKLGDIVEYWADIDTDNGGSIVEPPGGEIKPYTLYVGDVLEVRCDDFEDDDGGYRHRLLAGEETEGADDWQWGEPVGFGGDPIGAFSGTKVWGNDLGGGEYNGQYQNDKHNQLRSPKLKTKHYQGVFLRYMRWLTVEDGLYDRARITADGFEVWTNWASDVDEGDEHHLDDRWVPHVVDLGRAANDGEVVVAWEIISDQGLTWGGWTIDDACLYAPATADNRLGISDFTAERSGDSVALGWTNPKHAPVEEIRVVRARGHWPTGPDDGTVIWETDSPELDAPVAITDTDNRKNLFYAVYASDGETWLSWTKPDWNAAVVDPVGDIPEVGDKAAAAACGGCATGAPAGGLWLAGLGALALLRRRRA